MRIRYKTKTLAVNYSVSGARASGVGGIKYFGECWYLFVNTAKVHGQTKLVIFYLSPRDRLCFIHQDVVHLTP